MNFIDKLPETGSICRLDAPTYFPRFDVLRSDKTGKRYVGSCVDFKESLRQTQSRRVEGDQSRRPLAARSTTNYSLKI